MRLLTILSKGSWFDFGREMWLTEKQEQVSKRLDKLIADDFISVFTEEGNTVKCSKEDFIKIICS